jgi:hypothetical protein
MSRFVDAIITYRILKILTTPFDQTDAYRLGVIDAKGRVLKKQTELNSVEERDSYTLLHRMIYRLKRIIEKVPIENKRIVSFAAALSLIKEHIDATVEPLPSEFEARLLTITESLDLEEELFVVENFLAGRGIDGRSVPGFRQYLEDVSISNAVGLGFSSQATPVANPNLAGRDMGLLTRNRILRRKKPNV